MSYAIPSKVGSVLITVNPDLPDESYSDHDAEDVLFELFSSEKQEEKRNKVLGSQPSWALTYHLSPKRGNLLRWYEFNTPATVLEIGAGCGAITEVLVKKPDLAITALEMTRKRAHINALRNQKATNLKLVVDNLDHYNPRFKFDYAVCVGVLEYAGTFFHSPSPYGDFLVTIANLLKPGGKLLLAIENRLGLKYWAGAKEDHTHAFFDGHNGYPSRKSVQTFGKQELTSLLAAAGFGSTNFYYPYPDYKTPSFVFSDGFYPGNKASFPLKVLPAPTFDRPRETFFSEQSTMRYIEDNKLFPDFANSFLVEAKK